MKRHYLSPTFQPVPNFLPKRFPQAVVSILISGIIHKSDIDDDGCLDIYGYQYGYASTQDQP